MALAVKEKENQPPKLPPNSTWAETKKTLAAAAAASPERRSLPFLLEPPAMEASQTPIETTGSRCAPETARGRHVFEIAGYSLQKDLSVGKFIKSATFAVGGHDWRIRFYPNDGDVVPAEQKDYVAVFLERISKTGEVRALYDFRLVNLEIMRRSKVVARATKPSVFSALQPALGFRKFMKKQQRAGRAAFPPKRPPCDSVPRYCNHGDAGAV